MGLPADDSVLKGCFSRIHKAQPSEKRRGESFAEQLMDSVNFTSKKKAEGLG